MSATCWTVPSSSNSCGHFKFGGWKHLENFLRAVFACVFALFIYSSMFHSSSASSINDFTWLNVICINLFSRWEHYHSFVLFSVLCVCDGVTLSRSHFLFVCRRPPSHLDDSHSCYQIGHWYMLFTFKWYWPFLTIIILCHVVGVFSFLLLSNHILYRLSHIFRTVQITFSCQLWHFPSV